MSSRSGASLGLRNRPKETPHGTRTLAGVVPPAAPDGHRLPPEVRAAPALDPRRRRPLGRPARPAPVVGLPRAQLDDHAPAPLPPAQPRHPEPAPVLRRRRPALARPGAAHPRRGGAAFALL